MRLLIQRARGMGLQSRCSVDVQTNRKKYRTVGFFPLGNNPHHELTIAFCCM